MHVGPVVSSTRAKILSRSLWTLALSLLACASSASATSKYWIGGTTSDWGVNTNWSNTPGGAASGVPVAGDDATISLSTTTTVTRGGLSTSYTSPLNSLALDGLNGASVTLAQSQTTFLVNYLNVADSANSKAQIVLSGGTISAGSAYYGLGTNSTATITISGSGAYTGFCSLGYGVNSNVVFNQTAGTFSDGGADLFIAKFGDATARGTYNLTAGYMNLGQEMDVGATGSGTFHQSGGNAFAANINIGGGTAGNFILDGGSFTTNNPGTFVDYIGVNGKIYTQAATQGGNFYVRGSMLVDGGSVDVSKLNFVQNDSVTTNYLTVQNGGTFNSVTYYDDEGTLSTNVTSGANFTASNVVYLGANCTFTISNATLNAGTIYTIGSSNNNLVFNSGTINITGGGGMTVGYANYGYNFLGITPDLTSNKALGVTGALTIQPNASVTLDGGTLTAGTIALSGNGTFLYHTGALKFTGSNFTLGAGQLLGDTLELPNTRSLTTTGAYQAVLNSGATLYMDGGTLSAGGGISNYGTIQLASTLSRMSGGLLSNVGTISGTGRIDNVLSNTGTVQASSGDHVSFTASGNGNGGTIQLLGGVVDFAQTLTNNGRIMGRGSLFANGGLTNNGTMIFTGGPADVQGAVSNSATARVLVTGGSNTTFYGNVSNTAGATITVDPASVVTFLGTYTGGSVTGAGTQIYRAPGSFATVEGGGTTYVEPGASLTATHVLSSTLNVQGSTAIAANGSNAGTSRLNALNISGSTNAWTSQLNLTNNALVVDYTGASPLATIGNQIKSGYNGGAWNGNGITTSLGNAGRYGLGYGEASAIPTAAGGTFAGQAVDNTSALVKYTYFGDANLDGSVDAADFVLLSNNFGRSGANWTQADFNYDGTTNAADFVLLSNNFGSGPSGLGMTPAQLADYNATALGLGFSQAQVAAWDAKIIATPEPTSLMLAAGSLTLLARRRR